MKTIYFVRHGESEANIANITSGSEFETVLTKEGKTQAKRTGQRLKDKGIDLIVSSPMKRTMETARIIAKEIDFDPAKIVKKDSFVERGFGIYTGRPYNEYMKEALSYKPLHKSVESVEVMHARVTKGLEWLNQQKARRILLVSHGGVSRILRLMHQDLPHSHFYKLEGLPNAEIYEFKL